MSPDLIRALVISASVLIAVVVLIIVVTVAVVKRGEQAMAKDSGEHGLGSRH